MPKPVLKARKGTAMGKSKGLIKAPICSYHGTMLVFSPAELSWTCPTEGCTVKKYPKVIIEEQGGYPVVGKGVIDCVLYNGDGSHPTILLRASNNVTLDISAKSKLKRNAQGKYELTLVFDSIVTTDGITQKKKE